MAGRAVPAGGARSGPRTGRFHWPGAGLSRKKPVVLAGFSTGRRVRSVGAPSAGGAQEEMPGDRHHHPVQGWGWRRPDVGADQQPAGRRAERGGHQPAAHRVPADRRRGAVQDGRHHSRVLVSLHARHPGGAGVQPVQELRGVHRGGEKRAGQDESWRLGPELRQPRCPRAPERRLRHHEHLCALQGDG